MTDKFKEREFSYFMFLSVCYCGVSYGDDLRSIRVTYGRKTSTSNCSR